MNRKQRNAGFSLVELMVVVAIIGVLATIAVPNYLKFQAKAKQSNAKSELAGLFTAEKTFFTEYNVYHANLPYVGFVPDGLTEVAGCPDNPAVGVTRYYRTGFNGVAYAAAVGAASMKCGAAAGGGSATKLTYYDVTANVVMPATPGTAKAATITPATAAGAASTFLATSDGSVSSGKFDQWTISQDRALLNSVQGI